MDNETARKFHERAVLSARRFGFVESRDEIAQEVLCRFAEGRGKHQTIDQAVIDVIRHEHGRPGTPGYDRKRALLDANEPMGSDGSTRANADDGNQFHRLVELLSGIERATVCLSYLWGLKEHEIGYCFGFSEARANQIKKGAEKTLQTRLSREEQREREREKSSKIPCEVQVRPSLDSKTKRILEKVRGQATTRLVQGAQQKVQEAVSGSFAINTF